MSNSLISLLLQGKEVILPSFPENLDEIKAELASQGKVLNWMINPENGEVTFFLFEEIDG